MLQLYIWIGSRWLHRVRADGSPGPASWFARIKTRQDGQTTAEYALVLLAAAAVAFVLIAWAQSTDKLPAFFDMIIDSITGDVG
ncbi:MAG TPA: DUF4244 domain-containing protein [Actinomycetota bacterium]|nr:DUF4244 domain-containing protein [Actinomycetota bacterium]